MQYFGHAYLYNSNVISPTATVFVGGYDTNTEFWANSTRSVLGVYSDFMPNITSDSGGDFNIDCTTTNGGAGAIVTALAYNPANPNKVLGNGYMSIGSDNGGMYQGTSLITDADHVYRFDISNVLGLNSWGGSNGVLNDNGGVQCSLYITGGGTLNVYDSNNTYSGTTTIDQASTLSIWSLSGAVGQSPMGSSSGNVILMDNGQPLHHRLQQFAIGRRQERPDVQRHWPRHRQCQRPPHGPATYQPHPRMGQQRADHPRMDRATGAATGNYGQVTVSTNPPVSSGGMVSPIYVSGAYDGFFLNYGANGFEVATPTTTTLSNAGSGDLVNITVGSSGGSYTVPTGGQTVYALAVTLYPNQTYTISGSDPLTIASGGLMATAGNNSANLVVTAPLVFGSAFGGEAVIWVPTYASVTVAQVTSSNGLTVAMAGGGGTTGGNWQVLTLTADNSASLSGPITVASGNLKWTNDNRACALLQPALHQRRRHLSRRQHDCPHDQPGPGRHAGLVDKLQHDRQRQDHRPRLVRQSCRKWRLHDHQPEQ